MDWQKFVELALIILAIRWLMAAASAAVARMVAKIPPPPPAPQITRPILRQPGIMDPSLIPDTAKSKRWEACHLFSPFGKRPDRTCFGVQVYEPPIAMVCPECDLRQPTLQPGTTRICVYCGSQLMAHGSRVYWWPTCDDPDTTTQWGRQ